MKEFRYRIEKTVDGSVFCEFSGKHFIDREIEDILNHVRQIQSDDTIVRGTYETN